MKVAFGIDPGVTTGIAEAHDGRLVLVESATAVQCEEIVLAAHENRSASVCVYLEDARKRTWVTGGREKLQGVGSVKRDCTRWVEFCEHHGIPIRLIHPKSNATKLSADRFNAVSGWKQRTNEHARDAAMLLVLHERVKA